MESLGLSLQEDPQRYTLPRFLEDVVSRHGERSAIRFARSGRRSSSNLVCSIL